MTGELKAHEVTTSLGNAPPDEVDGGAEVALQVKVACSSACDLWGRTVRIVAPDGTLAKEVALVSFDGTSTRTNEFVVRAPFEPGEYTWKAVFPAQFGEGVLHEDSSTDIAICVKPHTTDVIVWDVPSSTPIDRDFAVKVGVECSCECNLAGQNIEVYDGEGAIVATDTLGEEPWADTSALYRAEVRLRAPSTERRHRWTIKFPEPDLEVLHGEASCILAFGTVRQPEHVITIEVVDKDAEIPVENAGVRLRPHAYRGSAYSIRTDCSGVARMSVPEGDYQLYVAGDQYEKLLPAVTVAGDVTIEAVLSDPLNSWRELS